MERKFWVLFSVDEWIICFLLIEKKSEKTNNVTSSCQWLNDDIEWFTWGEKLRNNSLSPLHKHIYFELTQIQLENTIFASFFLKRKHEWNEWFFSLDRVYSRKLKSKSSFQMQNVSITISHEIQIFVLFSNHTEFEQIDNITFTSQTKHFSKWSLIFILFVSSNGIFKSK